MAAFSTTLIEYTVDADDGYGWDVAFNLAMSTTDVTVTINVKLDGDDPGSSLRQIWENGVIAHWNDKGYFSDGTTLYKVKFDFNFVTSGEHQVVTVHDEEGRFDMNNWYTTSEGWEQSYQDETAAHEVGHMFGLPDEYEGGGSFDHYYTTGTLMSDLTVMDSTTTAGYENYFFSIQHYVETYGFNENNPNVDTLGLVLATLGTSGNNALNGTADMDALLGLAGNDVLNGLGANDRIEGGAGNDSLNGGTGTDYLEGGTGNDIYYVSAGDKVVEAASGGTDAVNSTTSFVLTAGSVVETLRAANPALNVSMSLIGNASAQFIQGNAGINVINGAGGADTMSGLGGNDTYYVDIGTDKIIDASGQGTDRLYTSVSYALAGAAAVETMQTTAPAATTALNLIGNSYINTLIGNNGSNMLNGAGGSDTLTGGGGRDSFRLSVAPSATNIDTIRDFNVADDEVQLENAVFTALSATPGILDADAFHIGAAAADTEDRIVYNSVNGGLYYDVDGTGSQGKVLIASMLANLSLTNLDFEIV